MAVAASYSIVDDRLIISGYIDYREKNQLLYLLDENPSVRVVEFHSCLGGNLGGGLTFAQLIRSKNMNTVASGQVSSACAIAFLGGVKRSFDTRSALNLLMFHAARPIDSRTTQPESERNNLEMLRLIDFYTNHKISEHAKSLIKGATSQNAVLVFMSVNNNLHEERQVKFCDDIGVIADTCRVIDDISAERDGIVVE